MKYELETKDLFKQILNHYMKIEYDSAPFFRYDILFILPKKIYTFRNSNLKMELKKKNIRILPHISRTTNIISRVLSEHEFDYLNPSQLDLDYIRLHINENKSLLYDIVKKDINKIIIDNIIKD